MEHVEYNTTIGQNDMNKYDTEYLSGAYVLMRIVDIPNIYIKVWTQKNEFPQRKNIRYLMQASIIRQRKL